MKIKTVGSLYFTIAAVTLIASWYLYFIIFHDPIFPSLVIIGWVNLILGLTFIFLAIGFLRTTGRAEKGRDFTHTTTMITDGIYAIVRHPLYLGWLLLYPAVIFLSQNWLVVILGCSGCICMVQIARLEDVTLIEKFGDPYKKYLNAIPRLNFLIGIIKLIKKNNSSG
jgi:protein-S-isoprenylcysteine O-methyltransferase Ste14